MCQQGSVTDLINNLKKTLAQQYPQVFISGRICFTKPTGEIFSLQKFPGEDAIVVEYASNYAEAALNRFEDGDLFYLDEMDEETLIRCILQEIGQ